MRFYAADPPVPWVVRRFSTVDGWEARANWRHYSANGRSRFRWLASFKAVYHVTLYRLLGARAMTTRAWWD